MSTQTVAHLRVKEPRKLVNNNESIQLLQQWKMQFKQFVKQDDRFKTFIASDMTWNPSLTNYGFQADTVEIQSALSTRGHFFTFSSGGSHSLMVFLLPLMV